MAIKYVGPNALSKLCSLVKTALAGKINKSDIVQTTSESGAAKVPSAAVTNNLQGQVDELNTKTTLTDVKNITFQTSGRRSIIWFYTNDAKTEGFRLDIDGNNRFIQYSSLPVSASSIIGTIYMS